jgi:hypothetical protein
LARTGRLLGSALGPKSIAEIWAAVFPEGNNDLADAKSVLGSFKPTS